jgi:hypothetical protein
MTALKRLGARLGWTRHSTALLSGFLLTLLLIGYVWWPLAADYLATFNPHYPWWVQVDWLLVGLFLAMSLLIMAGADLRSDLLIVAVGLAGGLVIEAWGTQTNLWRYYTNERPPLWIIPAWPIASLAIDRIYRALERWTTAGGRGMTDGAGRTPLRRNPHGSLTIDHWSLAHWLVFPTFYALMLAFVWPTLDKPLTVGALTVSALLIASPGDRRAAVLTFAAGSGLGYFLEVWGTTRACWTYYTLETPPLFAVLAHGLAAVAFWRTGSLLKAFRLRSTGFPPRRHGDAEF